MAKNGKAADRITLKVAETNSKFVGKGMSLIDPKVMEELGLSTGDVFEVNTKIKNGYWWSFPQ